MRLLIKMFRITKQTNFYLPKVIDQVAAEILRLVCYLSVLILVAIFTFLLMTGIKTFSQVSLIDFMFGPVWNPTAYSQPQYGILSLIFGTFLVSLVAMTITVPLGMAIAIYLSEVIGAKQREIIKPLIEMIASIPSVVIGVLGLIFIAPFIARIFHLSNGLNALTAGILVAVAALPSVASLAEDALFNVPHSQHTHPPPPAPPPRPPPPPSVREEER